MPQGQRLRRCCRLLQKTAVPTLMQASSYTFVQSAWHFPQSRTKHIQHPDAHSRVLHTFQTSKSMPDLVSIPNTLKTTTHRSHVAFRLHSQERRPNNKKQSNHHKPQSAMSFPVAAALYRDMGDALNKLVQRAQGTQLPTLTPARRHKHSTELPR